MTLSLPLVSCIQRCSGQGCTATSLLRFLGAFQDADTCDAIKAFISALLTRVQHEERQKLLLDIERISETYFAGAASPEEATSARKLYAVLHDLQHKYGTPPAQPGSL